MLLCVHVFVVCVCCMWSYIHVGANRLPLPLPLPPPSLDAPNFLVGQDTDQHAFAAHRLYCLVKENMKQLALVHVALWCIGEFGQHLRSAAPEGMFY